MFLAGGASETVPSGAQQPVTYTHCKPSENTEDRIKPSNYELNAVYAIVVCVCVCHANVYGICLAHAVLTFAQTLACTHPNGAPCTYPNAF